MKNKKELAKIIFIPIGLGIAELFIGFHGFLFLGAHLIPRLEQGAFLFALTGPLLAIYGVIAGILLFFRSKNQKKLSSVYAIVGGTIGAFIGTMVYFLDLFFLGFLGIFPDAEFFILFSLFMIIGHLVGLQSRKIKLWALILSIILVALLSIYFHVTVDPYPY